MRVTVTGASGFIGQAVVCRLLEENYKVCAVARREDVRWQSDSYVTWMFNDFLSNESLTELVKGCDAVIHLAGRAHIDSKRNKVSSELYRAINVDGAVRLYKAAADQGVGKFVFVSTVGVHGARFGQGKPISEMTPVCPVDEYSASKAEAEHRLWKIAAAGGPKLTIIRPALVIGPGAPGNLRRFVSVIAKGIPMVVPSQMNRRAYLALENLVDLLVLCIQGASTGTFLSANTEMVSTEQLMCWMAAGLGRPFRFARLPSGLIRAGAMMVGQKEVYDKLFGELLIDSTKARHSLKWEPVVSLERAFTNLGRSYSGFKHTA